MAEDKSIDSFCIPKSGNFLKKLLGHCVKHIPLISCRVMAQAQKNNVHLILCEINIYLCIFLFWVCMHEQKKNILSLNDSLPTNFDVQKTKFQILFDTLSQNWTRIEMFERRFHKVFQLKMLTVPHDMVLETTTALWAIIIVISVQKWN